MTTHELSHDDFAALFGAAPDSLSDGCRDLIDALDWRYVEIAGDELKQLYADLEDRLEQKAFSVVVPGDKSRWERGWGENLSEFADSDGAAAALVPKYIRPNLPLRLNGRFVKAASPDFELNWFRVFQRWLFETYLAPFDTIVELGSGSGINLGTLADLFPDKQIIGADWAESAVGIANEMNRLRGWNTAGRLFDFSAPDTTWTFPDNTAVLSMAALEQCGFDYEPLIDFLIRNKPGICVFAEPVVDWYDPEQYIDKLAIRAHHLRNFWTGFPEILDGLAAAGRIEILKQKRSGFGSLLHEAYSQIIWRPL